MRFLRKNTAVLITVGPFFDHTDGVTIETGLTITNERITLTADTDDGSAPTNILDNVTGATSGTDNDLNYITGNDAGMMQLELSAANTNSLGRMLLSITDAANHVPVFHEFMVVNAALYDAFFATSGGAIPNAAADAAGGLPISDAGGLDMDAILSRIGTPSNLGGGATLAFNLSDIESQTDDIGTAGAGLTGVPWNAAWDAEVESEVNDALVAQRLDELLNADSDIDGAAPPTVGSVFHEMMTKTAGSFTYSQTTDSLEAVRDNMGVPQTADVADGVVTVTLLDKTGLSLASTGLDLITLTELTAVPAASAELVDAINFIFMSIRNKRVTTSTLDSIHNDAGTAIAEAVVSDSGGVFTKEEYTDA